MINRMNRSKKLTTVLHDDRKLLALFSGIILSALAFVSVAITASIWYF